MPIVAADIKQRLSGGAANADPNASLGGVKSSQDAPLGLFDTRSSAEATAGDIEYRCVYIQNDHSTLTLVGAKIWIQVNTASASTTIAIGVGTSGLNAVEPATANESTAPAGVTFSEPADEAGGLALGDIPPGQHRAVWVRSTVNAGTVGPFTDTYSLRVKGDTLA